MISLKFGLPLVRDQAGNSLAFDMTWLKTTLASAASKAGHHGWWLADDLAEGITMFLRHDYPNSVIDLSKLEIEVQTVLRDVGYAEVAQNYQTIMPCHQISLARCLRRLPRNDQSEFFRRLGEEIAGLSATRPQNVHFSDLHDCVRGLMGIHAEANVNEAGSLLHKVVAFVRDHIQSLGWPSQVRC